LNALFRSLIDMELPVPQVVERANRLLIENHISSHYATLVCGKAEGTGEVEICNAGHCPPFVIREGDVNEIEATGFPVGLFSEKPYAVSRVKLEPGEALVLYTDGLTEARDPSQAEYGVERLASVLGRGRGLAPGRLAASCLEDLGAFLGGAPRTDDLTLMVVRRAP